MTDQNSTDPDARLAFEPLVSDSSSPKKWVAADGTKRTFVGELLDGSETIVVSKSFFRSKQRWEYFAEPKRLVLWLISQRDVSR